MVAPSGDGGGNGDSDSGVMVWIKMVVGGNGSGKFFRGGNGGGFWCM